MEYRLNEYLPLKQGLRLVIVSIKNWLDRAQWVSSIKTRIKTWFRASWISTLIAQWVSSIKTRIKTTIFYQLSRLAQWVSSIKTRIKTLLKIHLLSCMPTQWVSSIKTRIKTVKLPLTAEIFLQSQWVSSIKTRIKTFSIFCFMIYIDSMSIFH